VPSLVQWPLLADRPTVVRRGPHTFRHRYRLRLRLHVLLGPKLCKNGVGSLHGHAAEVRDQMRALSVAGERTFCPLVVSGLPSQVCSYDIPVHLRAFFFPTGSI